MQRSYHRRASISKGTEPKNRHALQAGEGPARELGLARHKQGSIPHNYSHQPLNFAVSSAMRLP